MEDGTTATVKCLGCSNPTRRVKHEDRNYDFCIPCLKTISERAWTNHGVGNKYEFGAKGVDNEPEVMNGRR